MFWRALKINCNHLRRNYIVGLGQELLYQLTAALTYTHGAQRTVASVGVRAKNHSAAAGKHLAGIGQGTLGEAGADTSDVVEGAALARHGHQQRPDRAGPGVLAGRPADDHDLLGEHVLDLDPGVAAASGLAKNELYEAALAARKEPR